MITVGDIIGLLQEANKVYIGWSGNIIELDVMDQLQMDAYKDYIVQSITPNEKCDIEIVVACTPMKRV